MNDFFSKMPNGTCRICGESHDTRFGAPIKYSVRHYAHVECGLKRWGEGFFDRLHGWQLEQLPVFAVKEAGLFEALEKYIEKHGHNKVPS